MSRSTRAASKAENHVWYLIIRLGVPVNDSSYSRKQHFDLVNKACKQLEVKVRPIGLYYKREDDFGQRYLFRFSGFRRDDDSALRLGESFLYAMAVVYGPLVDPEDFPLILRVPSNLIGDRNHIPVDELVELEKSRPGFERTLNFPEGQLGSFSGTSAISFESAWKITPFIFLDERLFHATRFLSTSQNDFYVAPGQIEEVIAEPERPPSSSSDQSRFENALQNAFKTVEAIIGDPPRDDRKFFQKLEAIGIDPHEEVGYGSKEPFHTVIRKMNLARDKKAAHGSTLDRTITFGEMLHFQTCSYYVVCAAIEKQLGESIC